MENLFDLCTTYSVNIIQFSEELREKLENYYGPIDADCPYITLCATEINELEIPEEYIDYDSMEFDEDSFEEILENKIGKYPYYLVFANSCTYNGMDGYKICNNIISTCSRPYEISLYLEKEINGKAIVCKESSHDVPMGSTTIIVGLTNEEYEKLEDANFSEIEEFANKYID